MRRKASITGPFIASCVIFMLALGWAFWQDYPTPERLAQSRLFQAFHLVNGLDKSFRYEQFVFEEDTVAQYDRLKTSMRKRFGNAFYTDPLDENYKTTMDHLTFYRILFVVSAFLMLGIILSLAYRLTHPINVGE
ncbi:hypothetical protein [Desulfovibrio inopinatus]|uniref:hypothetical protein n=1 Tax=Desulfovibrio inopinatus TaxID=102109 RepID=UPI000485F8F4|nr:hypothetical protein [Desulfovibrio inopinatus]